MLVDKVSEKLGLETRDLLSELTVTQALVRYFERNGVKVETEVHRYFPNSDRFLRIDMVLNNRIAIEVKTSLEMTPLVEGIGKAVLYLQFFKESWLCVPSNVMEVIQPALNILGGLPFRVLDFQTLELHERTESAMRKMPLETYIDSFSREES